MSLQDDLSKSLKYIRVDLFSCHMNLEHLIKNLAGGLVTEILNITLKGIVNVHWKLRSSNKWSGPIRNVKD